MSEDLKKKWSCVGSELLLLLNITAIYLVISNDFSLEKISVIVLLGIVLCMSMLTAVFKTINEKNAGNKCAKISRIFPLVEKKVSLVLLTVSLIMVIKEMFFPF